MLNGREYSNIKEDYKHVQTKKNMLETY